MFTHLSELDYVLEPYYCKLCDKKCTIEDEDYETCKVYQRGWYICEPCLKDWNSKPSSERTYAEIKRYLHGHPYGSPPTKT